MHSKRLRFLTGSRFHYNFGVNYCLGATGDQRLPLPLRYGLNKYHLSKMSSMSALEDVAHEADYKRSSKCAIWFEEGRIRVHGKLIGSWSADGMTLGEDEYIVKFGNDLEHGFYKSMEVTRGQELVLKSHDGVMDVCGAGNGEGKTVKQRRTELSYRKAIWRRVALYLIAKHVAN